MSATANLEADRLAGLVAKLQGEPVGAPLDLHLAWPYAAACIGKSIPSPRKSVRFTGSKRPFSPEPLLQAERDRSQRPIIANSGLIAGLHAPEQLHASRHAAHGQADDDQGCKGFRKGVAGVAQDGSFSAQVTIVEIE